jgi:hypothetical protein
MEGSLLEGEHGESFGMVASPLGKHDQLIKKKKICNKQYFSPRSKSRCDLGFAITLHSNIEIFHFFFLLCQNSILSVLIREAKF